MDVLFTRSTLVGCARYAKNVRTMQALQEVLFQFALVSIRNTQHTRLNKKSSKIRKSENELKEAMQRAELSLVEKIKVNTLKITECIHTIHYLIRKNIAVNTN